MFGADGTRHQSDDGLMTSRRIPSSRRRLAVAPQASTRQRRRSPRCDSLTRIGEAPRDRPVGEMAASGRNFRCNPQKIARRGRCAARMRGLSPQIATISARRVAAAGRFWQEGARNVGEGRHASSTNLTARRSR